MLLRGCVVALLCLLCYCVVGCCWLLGLLACWVVGLFGCWLLVVWLLVFGCWLLVVGCWLFGCLLFGVWCSLFVVRCLL